MRWLLEHGADPNAPPRLGHTVDLLTLAAASYPPSTVRLLVEHGARTEGTQALHAAATTSATEFDAGSFQPDPSRVEILKILLDYGADANEMEVYPRRSVGRLLRVTARLSIAQSSMGASRLFSVFPPTELTSHLPAGPA